MNDLTGERNVILGGLAMGMSREQIKERYQEIVDFSGINEKGDFITLPMRTYSSGMAARLRFSIAAAKDHDVLMIDEALATGDRKFQKRSEDRIRELREEAGTVFLVSHNNKSIRDTCDRVLWLETRRAAHGRPDRRGPQGVREVHRQVVRASRRQDRPSRPRRNCSGGAPRLQRKRQLRRRLRNLGANRCVLVMCRTPRRTLPRCTT